MPPYQFFLSYSRDDWDDYLGRFLDELQNELRGRLGLAKSDPIAFVDQRRIELGAD